VVAQEQKALLAKPFYYSEIGKSLQARLFIFRNYLKKEEVLVRTNSASATIVRLGRDRHGGARAQPRLAAARAAVRVSHSPSRARQEADVSIRPRRRTAGTPSLADRLLRGGAGVYYLQLKPYEAAIAREFI
jgi:hypothetical protein